MPNDVVQEEDIQTCNLMHAFRLANDHDFISVIQSGTFEYI